MIVALDRQFISNSGQKVLPTLAMNRPKTPPRAKPIPPDITVLTGHDSIAACI